MGKENGITLERCAEKYLSTRGLRASGPVAQLLTPFFIMDICYQIYDKEVRPRVLQHESKRYVKLFREEYNAFNKELFRVLDVDEADMVIDEMEGVEEFTHNNVMFCRVALLNILGMFPDEARDFMTSVLLCDFICQIANIVWTDMYRVLDNGRKGETNMHLKRLRSFSFKICNYYEKMQGQGCTIDLNKNRELSNCCSALTRKIVEYIKGLADE